jgi:hypothetical protein
VGLDVRRLAAVDMHGLKGGRIRPRVILAEFLFGAVAGPLLGLFMVVAADGVVWKLIGVAMIGIGLNYVPLARHALALRTPEALAAALDGVDVRPELRRYTALQLWVCVPLALVIFDRRQSDEPDDARSL